MTDLKRNKALALEFIEVLGRLDTQKFLDLMTDDVIFETPGASPVSGIKTKNQVGKEFPPMKEVLPNGIKFTIHTVTAEDDRVHIELSGNAKTTSGADYNNRYHYAMVIRDGKIAVFRDYLDHDLVLRVLVPTLARHGALRSDREREGL